MWAVDVLSKILEILCILELFKVAKVVCYGFLTKNSQVYFGGAVEL